MTASTSTKTKNEYPYYGRLHETRGHGVWCPATTSDKTDFLQVDMGTEHSVCAVATRGHEWGARVTSYKLRLSAGHFSSLHFPTSYFASNLISSCFTLGQCIR